MDIQLIRRKNLERLIERLGSQDVVAERIDSTSGWISQMITGRRPITEKTARKIEIGCGLQPYAMDSNPDEKVNKVSAYEIQGWSDEEELDNGKVLIPVYDVHLSAGAGSLAPEFVETTYRLPFERNWIKRKGHSEKDLRLMPVKGDSMLPVLGDGDLVLVDLSKREIIEGRIYAITIGHDVKIKRLKQMYDGSLVVMSDNPMPEYSDEIIPPNAVEHVYIIGQAVHRAGDL